MFVLDTDILTLVLRCHELLLPQLVGQVLL